MSAVDPDLARSFAGDLRAAISAWGRPVIGGSLGEVSDAGAVIERVLLDAPADAVVVLDGRLSPTADVSADAPADVTERCDEVVVLEDRPGDNAITSAAGRATIVVAAADPERPTLRRIGGRSGEMIALFSYGTLQGPGVQWQLFGRELDGAPDTLPGHRQEWLDITDASVVAASGSGRHSIVRASGDPADCVAGRVLWVTTDELAAADLYEVDDYRRTRVSLESGLEAWVYLAADTGFTDRL